MGSLVHLSVCFENGFTNHLLDLLYSPPAATQLQQLKLCIWTILETVDKEDSMTRDDIHLPELVKLTIGATDAAVASIIARKIRAPSLHTLSVLDKHGFESTGADMQARHSPQQHVVHQAPAFGGWLP